MSILLEDVSRYPLPGMAFPSDLKFSPDDRFVSFLLSPDRTLVNRLHTFDTKTGVLQVHSDLEETGNTSQGISLEEALRRERMRQLIEGVTEYEWLPDNRLLVPLRGDLYAKDDPSASLRKVLDSRGKPVQSPAASPDGASIAYVQEAEIYVVPFSGGEARQVTFGARQSGKTNGLAEFMAQEEMARRQGFWWSPDSRSIAFAEVDETHIPVYRIVHQGKPVFDETAQEDHRYPFAGKPNAQVRLGVVSLDNVHTPVWMDITSSLEDPADFYLARVNWFPDGSLLVQVENREQTELHLLHIDPKTGKSRLIHKEVNPIWINLHDLFKPLQNTQGRQGNFIWASERTGFRHLFMVDRASGEMRQLTSGDWMVDKLEGVDEEQGWVYFTGTLDGPTECHLYRVPLAGGAPQPLTTQPGMHTVTLDHACHRFVDVHHSLSQPPTVRLRSLKDGSLLADLYTETDPRLARLNLTPPELVRLHNRHGDLLYGALFRPLDDARYKKPYPLVVSVYGGPHAQMVTNGWNVTVSMRPQYLSSLGFLVFVLDNRGSYRRGQAFESEIKNKLGRPEVEDQVDGVAWLVDQGLADPKRVGIYGWSYGGYMSLMCLGQAPEVFRAAVSGAPVTHYDGYDTHYTERYMGKPQDDPERYALSSVMNYVENMTGSLMLVHGLIDENVHFRNTARLINALIKARKRYELLLFPDERHMPRRLEDRTFMEENIRDFFIRELS